MARTLAIENVGQIKQAKTSFSDLTVFVGPQAMGKNITLQLLKLTVDAGQVQDKMGRYGIDWAGDRKKFLDAYFGEGVHSIWREGVSQLSWNGKDVDLTKIAQRKRESKTENLF